ncbi:5382_t:CDS:2, partial [Ambispora gerdemannii]
IGFIGPGKFGLHPSLKSRIQTMVTTILLPYNFGKNQHIPIDDEKKESLKKLLSHFQAPIRYAFAYGSGVFPQKGYENAKANIFFYFWLAYMTISTKANQHRNHYSFVGMFGSRAVAMLQEKIDAGVYFNPYVEIDGMLIKYGVVSIDTLCKDLLDWDTLYVSGRMHKPIKILKDNARVRLANQVNLVSAFRTALLLLPKNFTAEELYIKIAELSYQGDFRRYVGENPKKVHNIVLRQMDNFSLLYGGIVTQFPNVEHIGNDLFQQNDDPKIRARLVQNLPRTLKGKIKEKHRNQLLRIGQHLPQDDFSACKSIASSPDCIKYLNSGITEIVFWPALTQSTKGVLTAGFYNSSRYIGNKLIKWARRK